MPNGEICPHHTALAVQVAQNETRLDEGETRMTRIEQSTRSIERAVWRMQRTLWRWGGAIAALVFLLSIFGPRIAKAIFGE